jgi:hypothetical protein
MYTVVILPDVAAAEDWTIYGEAEGREEECQPITGQDTPFRVTHQGPEEPGKSR